MRLHRLALVLGGVSLGCLAASVWVYWVYWKQADFGGGFGRPSFVQFILLANLLNTGGVSLALAAAVLLLLHFRQRKQRASFTTLLVLTVVLVAVQDSSVYEAFMPGVQLITSGPPTAASLAASLALDAAIHCAPSALLALLVLVYGFVGMRSAPPHSPASQDDSVLELHIEPLGPDVAD
jgi:hypothetical protein